MVGFFGYNHFLVILFLVTGVLMARFDTKRYDIAKMKKERNAASFLGWLNVALGVVIFAANWVYEQWFSFP